MARRRDVLAGVCIAITLIGIAGAFGVWMALIVGGLGLLILLIVDTWVQALRPTDGA